MEAPNPINSEQTKKEEMKNDLKNSFKNILEKYLDEREIKDEKMNNWMNNILIDAKEYFIKKYPNFNIFIQVYVKPRNINFRSNINVIYFENSDDYDSTSFTTNYLYSIIYFFFFKIVI